MSKPKRYSVRAILPVYMFVDAKNDLEAKEKGMKLAQEHYDAIRVQEKPFYIDSVIELSSKKTKDEEESGPQET